MKTKRTIRGTGYPQVDDHDGGGRRGRWRAARSRETPEQLASDFEAPQVARAPREAGVPIRSRAPPDLFTRALTGSDGFSFRSTAMGYATTSAPPSIRLLGTDEIKGSMVRRRMYISFSRIANNLRPWPLVDGDRRSHFRKCFA
jgi:hypothetical protein